MKFLALAAIATLVALPACVTLPPKYVAPPNLDPGTGATIVGSLTDSPSPLFSNTHVFLVSVDNRDTRIQLGGFSLDGWKTPTLVAPGSHLLNIEVCQCGYALFDPALRGTVTLSAALKPDETYTLRSTMPGGSSAVVWIEDSTGSAVTPQVELPLSSSQQQVFLPVLPRVH